MANNGRKALVVRGNQQGMALVIAIWILTLLSLMAGSFALSMRRESSVASALSSNAQTRALLETGLTLAKYQLKQTDPNQRWRTDGSIYQITPVAGATIRIRMIAEAGKIDINNAKESLLSAVVGAITNDKWEQQHLLNCILDWRDADDEQRPHGAEKKQYLEAGLPYGPPNRALQSLEELQMILGVNQAIFTQIQPWLTVYSGQSDVSLRDAMPEVLEIISNSLSDKNIRDANLQQKLHNNANPDPNNPENTNAEQIANQIYTIQVEAIMEDGGRAALEAVVRPGSGLETGQPGEQVLDWKQDQLLSSLFAETMESRVITIQDEFTIVN